MIKEHQWQPRSGLQHVQDGTTAQLLMPNGLTYRAIWEPRGRVTAWWPQNGTRKKAIGLYEPVAFRVTNRRTGA